VIYLAAVEMKGGAQQDKEPYPEAPLPPGDGYSKTPPNPSGRWEVSAYQWSPGTLVANTSEVQNGQSESRRNHGRLVWRWPCYGSIAFSKRLQGFWNKP
jgi:hypothetical protein